LKERPVEGLKPIRSRGNLGEKVYRGLKRAITLGQLTPGTWLQEEQLTQALAISRTPLREALNRLASEGLVEMAPRKGAHIVELTDRDLEELFEAREVIETTFFVRAARNMTLQDFERIKTGLDRAEEALHRARGDPVLWQEERERYLEADRAFHDELIAASGNRYWGRLYDHIRDLIQVYSHRISIDPELLRTAIHDHQAILEALVKGRLEEARGLMGRHIRNMKVNLEAIRDESHPAGGSAGGARAAFDRPPGGQGRGR